MRKTNSERFWIKVDQGDPSDCWMWMASRNGDGYGVFWMGDWRDPEHKIPNMGLAHRWVYADQVGPIPTDYYVLHSCDTPACVNPKHLWSGTQKDNVADCARKGRRNQTRYKKLSAALHEEIRRLYATGAGSQAEIGLRFGVTQHTVSRIVRKAVA